MCSLSLSIFFVAITVMRSIPNPSGVNVMNSSLAEGVGVKIGKYSFVWRMYWYVNKDLSVLKKKILFGIKPRLPQVIKINDARS